MLYRKLGKTGIEVGIIGLGAEYLEHASSDTVISVVDEALDQGINYIDLFMPSPDVRDNFGTALKNKRDKVMIAGHIGPILSNGQYTKSRDRILCERYFEDLLTRLQTDYIDVLMLHYVDEPEDYETVFDAKGLLDSALQFQKEGKARFIGLSSHQAVTALKAVNSGYIDVLMFSVNPAFDSLPGDLELPALHQHDSYRQSGLPEDKSAPGRRELYHACATYGVGVVAMKPYASGVLFAQGNPSSIVLTPIQCISYALSQPAVCTVVPGCKDVAEMKAALAFLEATEEEKDFSSINVSTLWKLRGSCVYCNHCLPCPADIDIGLITRITDTAGYGVEGRIISEYEELPVTAADCIECDLCTARCPFEVDIIANMHRAVEIFGK
jgi:predicted aldo/keto reductase-like oxidoreductase